jgi:hypothetical protein
MKLEITQDIINRSRRYSASACLLAHAGGKAYGCECLCDGDKLTVFKDGVFMGVDIPLTPEALRVVRDWDAGKSVHPCELTLPDA